MSPLVRSSLVLVLCMMASLAARPARASVTMLVTRRDLQGLTQTASHVIRARFLGYAPTPSGHRETSGPDGGMRVSGLLASAQPLARVKVEEVLIGGAKLTNQEVLISGDVFQLTPDLLGRYSTDRMLLFLEKDGPAFRVMPPTFYGDVVKSYPLESDGLWYPKKKAVRSIVLDRVRFDEELTMLPPRGVRSFGYDVPLAALGMNFDLDADAGSSSIFSPSAASPPAQVPVPADAGRARPQASHRDSIETSGIQEGS